VVFSSAARSGPATGKDSSSPVVFPESVRAAAPGAVGTISGLRSLEEVGEKSSPPPSKPLTTRSAAPPKLSAISRKTLLEKRKKYGLK